MRRIEELNQGESGIFGPGTDLVVSLAAVLIFVVAIEAMLHSEDLARLRQLEAIAAEDERGQILLDRVLESQRQFVEEVAARFATIPVSPREGVYALNIDEEPSFDIHFFNHVDRQRITFGSHILFDPDEVVLSATGQRAIASFSDALVGRLGDIREIHIEGHADTSPTERHRSNLELAAKRAIMVYQEIVASGVDPNVTIMSATSYGEFLSIQRFRANRDGREEYSRDRLRRDNRSAVQKRLNRRIEFRLVYTLQPPSGVADEHAVP